MLYKPSTQQFAKFAIVGIVSFVVDWLLLIVLAAAVIIAFSVRPARKRYYYDDADDLTPHENEFR